MVDCVPDPPLRILCEGSDCPTHVALHGQGMCAMCGRIVNYYDNGRAVPHDRDDVLAMIERGDYG